MKRITTVALLALAATESGCATPWEARIRSDMNNKIAPDFELTALDGRVVRLQDFRGQAVLLSFFAAG